MATNTKFKPETVLLIPDIHAMPGDKLVRIDALRKFLDGRLLDKLDKIVMIGDVWDFGSLCNHDKDTPDWNDRSVQEDLNAGFLAVKKVMDIANEFEVATKAIHFIEGNHEQRYNRWMASDNRLRTSPHPQTMRDVVKDAYGFNYHSFLQPAIINKTAFQHYHVSGVMNRPHSGERPALSMLRQHHMSVVQGHKHTLDLAEHTRPDSTKIYGLVCGCFVSPTGGFTYAGAARKLWWNGCHLLHYYAPGEFDVESISLARMSK